MITMVPPRHRGLVINGNSRASGRLCFLLIEVPFASDDSDMWVRTGVRWRGGGGSAPHAAIPFERFRRLLPRAAQPAAAAARPRGRRVRKEALETMLERYPWLDAEDLQADNRGRQPRRGGGTDSAYDVQAASKRRRTVAGVLDEEDDLGDGTDSEVARPKAHVAEVDAGSALDELAALRDELQWDDHDNSWFYSRLLGGAWTLGATGEVADGSVALARAGEPTAWCARYGWAKSRRYMFSKYGRDPAMALAREWARRADYFFRLWYDSADPAGFRYTQAHVDGYVDSVWFIDCLLGLDNEHPAFREGAALRDLSPRLG